MAVAVPLDVIQDAGRASALLHPLRQRLLEALHEPGSASALARQLRLPRQKINYHLRELEREGLVELVEERRKGNCVERVVRATAHAYLIDPTVLGNLAADPAHIQDRFSSAYLIAVAARAIRELAVLRSRAEKANKRLATITLETEVRFASAAERNTFAEQLASLVTRLVANYHNEEARGGRRFRLFLGSYPAAGKEEQ